MARYRAEIDSPREIRDVFEYLSDFANTAEWDPGVVEAERVGAAAPGVGAEVRLVASFLGRRTALTYRTVEYDPPHAVAFRGESSTVVSNDRISFEPAGAGTHVTYEAELALKGPLGIADPLLGLAFDRVGDRALAGLERSLGSARSDRLPTLSGRSLEGRDLVLPRDLPKPHNLLVAAFHREQQSLVDSWLPWLTELERDRGDVAVFELPIISARYGPVRAFIDGGMTRAIPDPSARARTITVYTDVDRAVRGLGLSGTDTIAVLAVAPGGRILARELGGFDGSKAERLATVLATAASEPAAKSTTSAGEVRA